MPYITQDAKTRIFQGDVPSTPGELNYRITQVLRCYLHLHGTNYTTLNDCLGALEGAKLELYRRVVVPYEESKRELNGEVYF